MTSLIRATIAHTPRDPFEVSDALESFEDGGLAFAGGRVLSCGEFRTVRARYPEAQVIDARGAVLLPGFVDCHVHYAQIGAIGAMGHELLEWLSTRALPLEAQIADPSVAVRTAEEFVSALARNGTTTALVFGSHFAAAQEALFEAARERGLRIASGLVVSDRLLMPELETSIERAFADSAALIERWHGSGRLRYAVTPRFAVSCSEGVLEVCEQLQRETDGLLFTTHVNENRGEIELVGSLFPWASDYLETYERYALVHSRSVLAHNVHPSMNELQRLAAARAWIAHCPSSNAFLRSGIFPMRGHLEHGVRFALGSDVGAGTGLSLFKEALWAYSMQMAAGGHPLTPAHLLYLATLAGARALDWDDETGDFTAGKSADFVLVRAPAASTLASVLARSLSVTDVLGALFTLAREEAIAEVRVGGEVVFSRSPSSHPAGP